MSAYGEPRLGITEGPYFNYVVEMTMTAGMLLLYGVLAIFPGTAGMAMTIERDQNWEGSAQFFPPINSLLATLIVVIISLVSIFIGFHWMVSRCGSKEISMFGLVIAYFSWFVFCVGIARISFDADKWDFGDDVFSVGRFFQNLTKGKIDSVATLGVIGYIAYAATIFGALVFLLTKMVRFQGSEYTKYNRGYYRSRMYYYGFLTLLAGVAQMALGAYIYHNIGGAGHLGVSFALGPYVVTYPEINMAVGACQIALALFIFLRASQKPSEDSNSAGICAFQCAAWFVLIVSISCQVLAQLATSTQNLSTLAMNTAYVLGLSLFPMYLDVMYYTTPETILDSAYTLTVSAKAVEEHKAESGTTTAA